MRDDDRSARSYAAGVLDCILNENPGQSESPIFSGAKGIFIMLTNVLWAARRDNDSPLIDAILSVFDADARQALILGAAALHVMDGSEHAQAMKKAMAETLYNDMRRQ